AMTNASKHSGASLCTVRLVFGHALELTVSDNGHGRPSAQGNGVGWSSMTERADELGGSCTVSECDGGGLMVHAVLPLRNEVVVDAVPCAAAGGARASLASGVGAR